MPSVRRRVFSGNGPVRVRQPFTITPMIRPPRAIGAYRADASSARRRRSTGTSDWASGRSIARTSPGLSRPSSGRLSGANSSDANSVRTSGDEPTFEARR